MDYNPHLKPWSKPLPNSAAGKGTIEKPGEVENLVWQNRSAEPSGYELSLADTLEIIFGEGVDDLEGLVGRLNELGSQTPDGNAWTPDSFEAEMARLGY